MQEIHTKQIFGFDENHASLNEIKIGFKQSVFAQYFVAKMKMMPPQKEIGLVKVMLCGNRSWIDDFPSPMFPPVQATPKRQLSNGSSQTAAPKGGAQTAAPKRQLSKGGSQTAAPKRGVQTAAPISGIDFKEASGA